MITIEPPSFILGAAFWTVKNTDLKLSAATASNSSSVTSRNDCGGLSPPAFTTTTSIGPSFAAASSKSRSRSSTEVTSQGMAIARSPRATEAASSRRGSRPQTATRAPSARNARATARPIPLVPPVTTATLPSSLPLRARSVVIAACALLRGGA